MIVRPHQPNGITLAALETPADPDVLITGMLIESQDPIKIISDPGDSAFPPGFGVPWAITKTPSGVLLSWRPGAGELGQIIGGSPPDNRYTLILKVNHKENPGVDFSTFGGRRFTVTAVPEPGLPVVLASLLAVGALAGRSRRR